MAKIKLRRTMTEDIYQILEGLELASPGQYRITTTVRFGDRAIEAAQLMLDIMSNWGDWIGLSGKILMRRAGSRKSEVAKGLTRLRHLNAVERHRCSGQWVYCFHSEMTQHLTRRGK